MFLTLEAQNEPRDVRITTWAKHGEEENEMELLALSRTHLDNK